MGTTLGGGPICNVGSMFTPDGKYLITAGPNAVYAHSARTSQRVAVLYENIKTFGVDSKRNNAVCIATTDGWFNLWDISAQRVTHKIDLKHPIFELVIPKNGRIAFISLVMPDRVKGKVVKVDLDTWTVTKWKHESNKRMNLLSCDASGDYLAIAARWKYGVAIVRSNEPPKDRKQLLLATNSVHKSPVMSFAMDSSGRFVAVGLEDGTIILYHNVDQMVASGNEADARKPTSLLWHSNGVTALDFSPDSVYLTSAGMEGVLVMWDLETLKPMFVPRLGGEIMNISHNPMDPSVYVVALKQNMVKVVNTASYQIQGAVCGVITPPRDTPSAEATGVCQLHPQTGWVAFTGDNGIMQFYDVVRNKHMRHLQTLPRAKMSLVEYAGDKKKRPAESRVKSMAFNSDGTVLVTVGVRPKGGVRHGLLTTLQFWDRKPGSHEPYEVNTVVEEPHRDGISCLTYSRADDLALTTSKGGDFKVWAKQTIDNVISWRCRSIGSYREESMGGAAFSGDGTVLAVACKTCITLWDPITLTRLGMLPFPAKIGGLSALPQLEFVSDTQYLVGCCPETQVLIVWDLLTMDIHWAVPLNADHLTTDAVSQKFAVVLRNPEYRNGGVIAVFSPEDSTPRGLYAQPRGAACCLRFASPGSPLFAAGQAMENGRRSSHAPLLVILASRQFTIETGTGSLQMLVEELDSPRSTLNGVPSPLELAFGPSASKGNEDEEDEQNEEVGASACNSKSYFSDIKKIPSHKVPPLGIMTSDLLDRLILKKRKRWGNDERENVADSHGQPKRLR
ncbi:hypothetical protein BSKO_01684 [Bryopsis sp. KO-2023]|nr:hypothetical protein BSKO_01684 [Bryopsis sp. KO-2023]